jgi:hypothetical protein
VYGVPADLDLSRFQGAELIQICLGEFQIQFHFHPKGMISAEGNWELRNASADVIDKAQSNGERDVCRLHVLLGKAVNTHSIDPPQSFSLGFESGHVLTILLGHTRRMKSHRARQKTLCRNQRVKTMLYLSEDLWKVTRIEAILG